MDRKEVLRLAFKFSMKEEGGDKYTDDKRDAGGPTKYGMALNYNKDTIPDKDGNGIINAKDVMLLEEKDALKMYEDRYWRPNIKPEYPDALSFMMVDMCLNPGPGITPKLLQQALNKCGNNLSVDGKIGKLTIAAIKKTSLTALLSALSKERLSYYESRPKFDIYGKGWSARTKRCLTEAMKLI